MRKDVHTRPAWAGIAGQLPAKPARLAVE